MVLSLSGIYHADSNQLFFLYFGALGSVGPTPIHPELGCEKAEGT